MELYQIWQRRKDNGAEISANASSGKEKRSLTQNWKFPIKFYSIASFGR